MAEPSLGQVVHVMVAAPGVEHIGHQHDVVVGEYVDAAPGENLPVELEILADLQHAGSSSIDWISFSASFSGIWLGES